MDLVGDCLCNHNPMAINGAQTKFTHPPGFILEGFEGDDIAIADDLVININIVPNPVSKVGVIADLSDRHCVRAMICEDTIGAIGVHSLRERTTLIEPRN